MGDARALVDSIRRVAKAGRDGGWYWRERYNQNGGYGAAKYCEYPANLIRIVERFLLGVELRLDGSITLAPTVPAEFWERGFGQILRWRGRVLDYRMHRERVSGTYSGLSPQLLQVRLARGEAQRIKLPPASTDRPHRFEVQ